MDELKMLITKIPYKGIDDKNVYTKKALANNTYSNGFWSSSPSVSYDSHAWSVSFSSGSTNGYSKSYKYYVRCVRSKQKLR
jgi:hypothetical protein